MTTLRTVALGIAAAVSLWTAAPALAGPGRGGPAGRGHAGPPVDRGQSAAVKGDAKGAKDETTAGDKKADKKQAEKPKSNDDTGTDDTQHSNKGGELRGLDRADEVAGEHGTQGRDRARVEQAR